MIATPLLMIRAISWGLTNDLGASATLATKASYKLGKVGVSKSLSRSSLALFKAFQKRKCRISSAVTLIRLLLAHTDATLYQSQKMAVHSMAIKKVL